MAKKIKITKKIKDLLKSEGYFFNNDKMMNGRRSSIGIWLRSSHDIFYVGKGWIAAKQNYDLQKSKQKEAKMRSEKNGAVD